MLTSIFKQRKIVTGYQNQGRSPLLPASLPALVAPLKTIARAPFYPHYYPQPAYVPAPIYPEPIIPYAQPSYVPPNANYPGYLLPQAPKYPQQPLWRLPKGKQLPGAPIAGSWTQNSGVGAYAGTY